MIEAVALPSNITLGAISLVCDETSQWPPKAWPQHPIRAVTVTRFLEYLTGMERIDFFNRVDKSLTPDGKIHITVPYYSHPQAFADWRIQWPPFSEHSFLFLDAEWRAARAWTAGLGYESDLKLINYEYDMVTDLTTRSDDFQSFSVEHYLGIVSRLFVTLGKKREED